MADANHSIGAFKADEPLLLERAENGGWTVTVRGRMGEMGRTLGAYTTSADMLAALSAALMPVEV